jgi:hypothetical protein
MRRPHQVIAFTLQQTARLLQTILPWRFSVRAGAALIWQVRSSATVTSDVAAPVWAFLCTGGERCRPRARPRQGRVDPWTRAASGMDARPATVAQPDPRHGTARSAPARRHDADRPWAGPSHPLARHHCGQGRPRRWAQSASRSVRQPRALADGAPGSRPRRPWRLLGARLGGSGSAGHWRLRPGARAMALGPRQLWQGARARPAHGRNSPVVGSARRHLLRRRVGPQRESLLRQRRARLASASVLAGVGHSALVTRLPGRGRDPAAGSGAGHDHGHVWPQR